MRAIQWLHSMVEYHHRRHVHRIVLYHTMLPSIKAKYFVSKSNHKYPVCVYRSVFEMMINSNLINLYVFWLISFFSSSSSPIHCRTLIWRFYDTGSKYYSTVSSCKYSRIQLKTYGEWDQKPHKKYAHTHSHTHNSIFWLTMPCNYSEADFNSAKCFSWCVKIGYCVGVCVCVESQCNSDIENNGHWNFKVHYTRHSYCSKVGPWNQ